MVKMRGLRKSAIQIIVDNELFMNYYNDILIAVEETSK